MKKIVVALIVLLLSVIVSLYLGSVGPAERVSKPTERKQSKPSTGGTQDTALARLMKAMGPDMLDATEVPDIYKPIYTGGAGLGESVNWPADLPFKKIELYRSPCYGDCPVYRFTLYNNGNAELDAIKHMPKLGRFTGDVNINEYARLCYAIEKLGFLKLHDSYMRNETDLSFCTIIVETSLGQKKVLDYGEVGPIELWIIQKLLDRTREQVDWLASRTGSGR